MNRLSSFLSSGVKRSLSNISDLGIDLESLSKSSEGMIFNKELQSYSFICDYCKSYVNKLQFLNEYFNE